MKPSFDVLPSMPGASGSAQPGWGGALGAHAHTEFAIAVIGVAKTVFRIATHAIAVRRGTSRTPGVRHRRTDAASLVQNMAGRFRIPDAPRRADTLARTGPPTATQTSHHPANERAYRGN